MALRSAIASEGAKASSSACLSAADPWRTDVAEVGLVQDRAVVRDRFASPHLGIGGKAVVGAFPRGGREQGSISFSFFRSRG